MGRVFFCSTLLSAALAAAAQSSQTDPATQTIKTQARDVIVDVVVTGNDGKPVTGLKAANFAVSEDGKPQTIDFFEEHQNKALPPGAVPPLPKMPPNVYTNVPRVPSSNAVNVLLFDMLNTDPQDQAYVRQQVLKYLLSVKPGTRIGIYVLGTRLWFVQGFTDDAAALRATMEKLTTGRQALSDTQSDAQDDKVAAATLATMLGATTSKGGGMGSSPQTQALQSFFHTSSEFSGVNALASGLAEMAQMRQADRTAMTLEALQYLARYLGDVPGRKNLLWFSAQFPVILYPSPEQQLQVSTERGYVSQARAAANQLTASKVAVYPISAEGVMMNHSMAPDNDLAVAQRGGNLAGSLLGEANSRSDTIYAMEQIAADTGGKAYFNTNDLSAAVNTAIDDGSHYYTLTYSPTNKAMNGRYRKVEVKLPGQKVKLSYRRGYNASDAKSTVEKDSANPLQPLLVRGLPGTTQILFAARVLPTAEQPGPDAKLAGRNPKLARPIRRYAVDLFIRWTDVKLDEAADGNHTGEIEVELLAYDAKGQTVNWTGGMQSMRLEPKIFNAVKNSGLPAHLEIDLPANEDVFLEAGVYDWGTGKAGTLEVPLHAQATAAETRGGH